MSESGLKVYDLKNKRIVEEKIYGGDVLRMFYSSYPLRFFLHNRLVQKNLSRVAGIYKRNPLSRRQIEKFLKDYEISLDEYSVPSAGFRNFNEFFIRKKKNIEFPNDPSIFPSPCEARLSVSRIEKGIPRLKVKGLEVALPDLLGSAAPLAPRTGWALIFRLCPVDYHRFHFVDSGIVDAPIRAGTKLHSVNPLALEKFPKIFEWNERQISIQHSEHYGEVFYIEVGALCVGRIHQTYGLGSRVERGQEKGYFDFGGSTVVLVVDDRVRIDPIIEEKNREGFEVLVRLGERIGGWN